jgi:protein involved in sex pheromone biosynthesis
MNRLAVLLVFTLLLVSACGSRRDGPTNKYKNAKTKTSETILKDHQKAGRKATRVLKRNEKKARERGNKRNGDFFKK